MKEFRVHIESLPYMDGIGIYFLRYDGDKMFIGKINEEHYIEWEETSGYSMERKPTFYVGGYFSHCFLQEFANALDDRNIKTDKDAKVEGKFESQRYHLEDLRKLLKLNE
jgi:hypothetical protein